MTPWPDRFATDGDRAKPHEFPPFEDAADRHHLLHGLGPQPMPESLDSFAQLRLAAPAGQTPASRSTSWICGAGRLSRITSNCAVWRDRDSGVDGLGRTVSVVVQLQGGPTYLGQNGRRCRLVAGTVCLVDGAQTFQIEPAGACYTHLVLSLPRQAVLQRFPDLVASTALALDTEEPGTRTYRGTMIEALRGMTQLDARQRQTTLEALVHLLGVLRLPAPLEGSGRRLEPALRFIEDHLQEADLDAASVALSVGLSRRRLDEHFVRRFGLSVTAHVHHRRLGEAAAALSDARQRHRSVSDIAYSLGFVDAAHFARTFKRHYGVTATAWRQAASSPI